MSQIVCLPYSDSYEWVNKSNPRARKENYFHFLKEKVPFVYFKTTTVIFIEFTWNVNSILVTIRESIV